MKRIAISAEVEAAILEAEVRSAKLASAFYKQDYITSGDLIEDLASRVKASNTRINEAMKNRG
jgi:hypothetical protein